MWSKTRQVLGNYFIRLLAVLDARLGKRRVKALADNIDNEPEWFRKWIMLRTQISVPSMKG